MLRELGLTLSLVARANVWDGYQLPPMTFIDNVSPVINDQGTVAFKLLSFQDGQPGMVIVPKGGQSELVHGSLPELYLTDPSLDNQSRVYFSEFSELGPVGLYHYDEKKKLHKLLGSEELFEYSAIGTPVAHRSGYCVRLTRGSDARASREVHCASDSGELSRKFAEGQKVRGNERASYLFTPAFNFDGAMAFKVRLGARGDFAEERPDVIVLVDEEGLSFIAEDSEANVTSQIISFNNSVSLNSRGEVAFVGKRKDGKSCLLVASKRQSEVLLCEGSEGIKALEYFTPVINDRGSVAFRAIDEKGMRRVYLLKQGEKAPRALVGEGDVVPTDLGSDKIIFREGFPGLSGNIGLNNNDEIVFHGILETSGAAIFTVSEYP